MTPSIRAADGDALLERLLSGATDEVAHELLRAFFAGYPVERLRLALKSEDGDIVRAGVWIASELGSVAGPLIDNLGLLLQHPLKYVRFFAIDAVLAAATAGDGEILARAAALVEDPEEAVRWKALHLLARASPAQLAAASASSGRGDIGDRLSWLAGAAPRLEDIVVRLDGDRLDRMFGVAAAARMPRGRASALKRASASADNEVRSFAEEELAASAQ